MTSRVLGRAGVLAALSALCAASSGCSAEQADDPNAVVIGLLLPFTGTEAATASNYERAALYARDRINDGGGVKGRHVRVLSADTHSDLERAKKSVASLIDAGAVAVIGPESAEIAAEIKPILDEANVVFISPLVASVTDGGVDCTTPWFRLAPSAETLGQALAKDMAMRSVSRAVVLHSNGLYDAWLGNSLISRFQTLGGEVAFEQTIDPNAQSYGSAINDALRANADAIVLSTSARSAALAVNELGALAATAPRQWFLSPPLKTDLLVQNVAPDALEGAIGVAPGIYDTTDDFPSAFSKRWLGDEPLEGAYFYYDAMTLLAFALQKEGATVADAGAGNAPTDAGASDAGAHDAGASDAGAHDAGASDAGSSDAGAPSPAAAHAAALRNAILAVAGPPGEPLGWNDVESALTRLGTGDQIYFSGLTGPMLLTSCGLRRLGTSATWTVTNGQIEDVAP